MSRKLSEGAFTKPISNRAASPHLQSEKLKAFYYIYVQVEKLLKVSDQDC